MLEARSIVDVYTRKVLSFPYLVIFLSLTLVAISVAGVRYLGLSTDYRVFFSEENPQLQAFDALQDTFLKNDNIFIVVKPRQGDVFTQETLAAIEALTDAAWQIPFSRRVDSLTNFQHTSAQGDELIVEDLVKNAAQLSQEKLNQIRSIALNDQRLLNRIISPDASTTSVNVTLQLPGKSRKEVPEAVTYTRNLVAELMQEHPNQEIRLTGNVLMSNAVSEASVKDMTSLVPLMYGVIVLCIMVFLRSIVATLLVSLVVGLSTMTAVGLAGWAGIVVTPPSASAPTVIMTLSVAGCIHILTTFLIGIGNGQEKLNAMRESLNFNMEAVFLTTLTTAIGFLSMNFSDSPPLRDLGNISAMGIIAAFVFSVFTLPAAALLLPIKPLKTGKKYVQMMQTMGEFVIKRQKFLLTSLIAIVVVLISFVPNLELNDQYVNYFDSSSKFRQDTEFAMNHLTGIYKIEYKLPAGDSGGISKPEYLRVLEAFGDWYRKQPEVVHVSSLVETMKTLNKNLHGDDAAYFRLPDNRDLAAQYLLLYEMSLPYGLDLNSQVSIGKDSTRFTVMVKNISTNELMGLEERAQAWLRANAPATMVSDGTGSSIVFAHISERSIRSMIEGTLLAAVLIGLILMMALKSVKYGILSFIPNLLPALTALGIWTIFVGELGFALSVMIAMTLGIVVDDTIHFFTKYLRGRQILNLSPTESVRYAFSTVGVAIVVTSIVLVLGFFVLAQSSFLPNSGMALLSVITIIVALIIDLMLVPPMLMAIDNRMPYPVLIPEHQEE